MPLRSSGRTLGVLTLVFARPRPLDEGPDQIALTALASAVADALSRASQHDSDRDPVSYTHLDVYKRQADTDQ